MWIKDGKTIGLMEALTDFCDSVDVARTDAQQQQALVDEMVAALMHARGCEKQYCSICRVLIDKALAKACERKDGE
jgi:ferredoxin